MKYLNIIPIVSIVIILYGIYFQYRHHQIEKEEEKTEKYWEGFRAGLVKCTHGSDTWGIIGMPSEEKIFDALCKKWGKEHCKGEK